MWWPETRAELRPVRSSCARVLVRRRLCALAGGSPPAASSRSMATCSIASAAASRRLRATSLRGGRGVQRRSSRPERQPRLARVGVEVRNQLIFDLTGGGGSSRPRTASTSGSPPLSCR